VTGRPGWRRHLPPLLLLAALGVLVVALARPQRTVAAPQRQATIMMVTDTSGSMRATDVEPDRLSAAESSARTLLGKLPDQFRIGLVTFADFAEQQAAPTTDRGGTAMGDGLARGLRAARTPVPGPDPRRLRRLPAAIVLLSDGKQTSGAMEPLDAAAEARRQRVPIFAIALGTEDGEIVQNDPFGFTQRIPVPPDKGTLRQIARISGGRYFEAPTAKDLESIYSGLGTRLSSKEEKREVTAAFAGGGLVLLLVGGALSLSWFGRLP
jgi:Ca-activated chloride channel homolog